MDGFDVRDNEIILDLLRMSAFHGISLDAMLRDDAARALAMPVIAPHIAPDSR